MGSSIVDAFIQRQDPMYRLALFLVNADRETRKQSYLKQVASGQLKVTEADIDTALDINEKYSLWILIQISKGNLPNGMVGSAVNNLRDLVNQFNLLIQSKTFTGSKDLMSYKTFEEFKTQVDKSIAAGELPQKTQEKQQIVVGQQVVANEGPLTAVIPEDKSQPDETSTQPPRAPAKKAPPTSPKPSGTPVKNVVAPSAKPVKKAQTGFGTNQPNNGSYSESRTFVPSAQPIDRHDLVETKQPVTDVRLDQEQGKETNKKKIKPKLIVNEDPTTLYNEIHQQGALAMDFKALSEAMVRAAAYCASGDAQKIMLADRILVHCLDMMKAASKYLTAAYTWSVPGMKQRIRESGSLEEFMWDLAEYPHKVVGIEFQVATHGPDSLQGGELKDWHKRQTCFTLNLDDGSTLPGYFNQELSDAEVAFLKNLVEVGNARRADPKNLVRAQKEVGHVGAIIQGLVENFNELDEAIELFATHLDEADKPTFDAYAHMAGRAAAVGSRLADLARFVGVQANLKEVYSYCKAQHMNPIMKSVFEKGFVKVQAHPHFENKLTGVDLSDQTVLVNVIGKPGFTIGEYDMVLRKLGGWGLGMETEGKISKGVDKDVSEVEAPVAKAEQEPAAEDTAMRLSSFQRTATNEEYGPVMSFEERRKRALDYWRRVTQKATNPAAPEGTVLAPQKRDHPQDPSGHTRSPYSATRIAEQLMMEVARGFFLTAQEAFNGYIAGGWKYASPDQKAELCRILRSYGHAIEYKPMDGSEVAKLQMTASLNYDKCECCGCAHEKTDKLDKPAKCDKCKAKAEKKAELVTSLRQAALEVRAGLGMYIVEPLPDDWAGKPIVATNASPDVYADACLLVLSACMPQDEFMGLETELQGMKGQAKMDTLHALMVQAAPRGTVLSAKGEMLQYAADSEGSSGMHVTDPDTFTIPTSTHAEGFEHKELGDEKPQKTSEALKQQLDNVRTAMINATVDEAESLLEVAEELKIAVETAAQLEAAE